MMRSVASGGKSASKSHLSRLKSILPDLAFLILRYKRKFGIFPNIVNPKTFNEKVLYRMLFDRRRILIDLSDKYAVRDYVKERIGAHILPELYCVTKNPAEIPFNDLPDKFVVKPTHGSGWIFLVPDKASLNEQELIDECNSWLKQNYYEIDREWVYKHIVRRIIVEEFISDGTGMVPRDYKLFVFGGKVELIDVHVDRFGDHRSNFWGRSWNKIDASRVHKKIVGEIDRPKHLDDMIRYAETLSGGLDFVRVDFYDTEEKVYFGEITTSPGGGVGAFDPNAFDLYVGRLWNLSIASHGRADAQTG